MTDSMKEGKVYDTHTSPMQYHIVECSSETGEFNIFNENTIFYGLEFYNASLFNFNRKVVLV